MSLLTKSQRDMSLLTKSSSSSSTKKNKSTMQHFTHIKHPLKVVDSKDKEFNCDGCNTLGSGQRYHCKKCKFDLHLDCAASPTYLSSHIHPIHQLKQIWEKKTDDQNVLKEACGIAGHGGGYSYYKGNPPCNVCGEEVKGLFYECPVSSCDFVLHPICSMFPPVVQHLVDQKHGRLTFQLAKSNWCTICGEICTNWRYRCGPCGIDIHLECIVVAVPIPVVVAAAAPDNLKPPYLGPHDGPTKHKHPINPGFYDDGYAIGMPSTSSHSMYHPINYGTSRYQGGTCKSSNGCKSSSDRKRERRRIYAIVGRIAVMAVVTAILVL